jgi:lysophospholipase III
MSSFLSLSIATLSVSVFSLVNVRGNPPSQSPPTAFQPSADSWMMNVIKPAFVLLVAFLCVTVFSQSGDYLQSPGSDLLNALARGEISEAEFCGALEQHSGIFVGGKLCLSSIPDGAFIAEKWLASLPAGTTVERNPIVLVPGLGGSALQLKLHHKEKLPHWYCTKKINWFLAWLHLDELLPGVSDCFANNMQMSFNPASGVFSNAEGVETRPADFGGIKGVDYLDRAAGIPVPLTGYYATIIKALEKTGYTVGVDLYGAPYDWRVHTASLDSNVDSDGTTWMAKVKDLIATAHKNTGKKVNLVTHSMGGPTMLYFLNHNPEFANEHVANFVPIAAPWMGAAKAIVALLYGDNFGIAVGSLNLVSPLKFREIIRTYGGATYMTPDAALYGNQTFVTYEGVEYQAHQIGALLRKIGAPSTADIWDATQGELNALQRPDVPTYCLYGTGVPTEIAYVYTNTDMNKRPDAVDSNRGDGTVPLESLRVCQAWQKDGGAPVAIREFDERDHVGILKDDGVIMEILKICTTQTTTK